MFSAIFIKRPILATVCSVVIMLLGIVSIITLPVSQFPELVPPQVTVTALYPGATPEVIAQVVASPLESQINGVDNMIYMNSVSTGQGSMTLTVTFELGTDPDMATINVNNRVQMATSSIPEEVRKYGIVVKKSSPNLLLIATLTSPEGLYDTIYMSNYALINILDDLKRIPGVSDALIYTSQDYAMRVWIKPDKLAQLGLAPADIAAAIKDLNRQYALGRFGDFPTKADLEKTYIVTTKGRLTSPEEFENIIIRANPDGTTVYLRDVAKVELGAKTYNFIGKQNEIPAVPIGVTLAPGANAIKVCDLVKKEFERSSAHFPNGIKYDIPYDTTTFVRVSIEEVVKTLIEAMALVFLVVFLFLQNWRATLIPCMAVPVSIIGTFAGLKLFGFSINTLTLFGLVLAIGIVVDDAIVVLENVDRHMENGHSPREASFMAMEEVTGPVIAIVLVLSSVFLPIAFLGGLTGELYKQFAITIATSVIISGFVALTLTPAMCAILLKPKKEKEIFLFRWFNSFFDSLTNAYSAGVRFFLKRTFIVLLLLAIFSAATYKMASVIPTSLVPNEDQGIIMSAMSLPDGASLQLTEKLTDKVTAITKNMDNVKTALVFTGYNLLNSANQSNYGAAFITLKDWKEREVPGKDSFSAASEIMGKAWSIPDGQVYVFNPPAIIGMSTTGGIEGYIQNRGSDGLEEMERAVAAYISATETRREISSVTTTFSTKVPQFYANLDRNRAKALGVDLDDVFSTMGSIFRNFYVNDFDRSGRTFQVLISAESSYRDRPEDLRYVYVRSKSGDMIPLSSLVDLREITGPDTVERFNVFPAAKVTGTPAAGYTSGQAIKAMEEAARESLSEEYALAWTGSAYQEKQTGAATAIAFVLGIIMVFLILAAQYERWSLPFAVVLAIPFALFGAFLSILLRGLSNDLYFQVALVTLIGLAAKNAILIVEFAVMKHEEGMGIREAAALAAHLRFRPILMTSLAFILGCTPLALSAGAGAASRHSIGTGIIGGMLAATAIAIFFVPSFFSVIMRMASKKEPKTTHGRINGITEGDTMPSALSDGEVR